MLCHLAIDSDLTDIYLNENLDLTCVLQFISLANICSLHMVKELSEWLLIS